MRTFTVAQPELILIAATRALLGLGAGLLLAPHLSPSRRRPLGYSLLSVGLLSTIPLLAHLLRSSPRSTHQSDAPYEPVLSI